MSLNQCFSVDQTNDRTIACGQNTYLKFLLVKRLKEMLRNKLIKTFLQSQELCLYSSHKSPIHIQPGGGGREKVRDSELVRTGLFIAELEDAHFTEELGLMHTFSIMRVFTSFFSISNSYLLDNTFTGYIFVLQYLTYSFLFSSVTGIFLPFGLSSCCKIRPKALCSTQNVWSRTGVISFSLTTERQGVNLLVWIVSQLSVVMLTLLNT